MENTSPPPSLLLLPAPASWDRPSLRTACGPTLSNVLPFVAKSVQDTNYVARLDLAVVLPESIDVKNTPRALLFAQTQTLLRELYTLLCSIAVENGVELDIPGGLDARVFMLEAIREGQSSSQPASDAYSGPLVKVSTLVTARRRYDPVFSVESEQGEHILQSFLKLHNVLPNASPPNVRRIIGGTSMTTPSSTTKEPATEPTHSPKPHYSVIVGGTFDHLHIGHKLLLTGTALALSPPDSATPTDRVITIGITGDELLTNKKFAAEVESWDLRQKRTEEFFESIFAFPAAKDLLGSRMTQKISRPGPNGHLVRVTFRSFTSDSTTTINYTRISDPYGPTITDQNISALVISRETRAGGKAVNDKRTEKGWAPLDIFEVDVLDGSPGTEDKYTGVLPKDTFESKISSTEMRRKLAALRGGNN
jgi:phosphopantetheine adenylyltransferase